MKPIPVKRKIIVFPCEPEDSTESGLIAFPDTALKKTNEGDVVALASDCVLGLKVGDRVSYNSYGCQPIEYDGETMAIMREEEVYFVIEYDAGGTT